MPATSARAAVDNPYPGLRPFRSDEDHLFFGRENQVNTMVDKLARTRFLAVVGTSGSGKSSLVNCGLRPALHRGLMAKAGTAWRVAQFRPGGNPIRAMARALAADRVLFSEAESESGPGLSLADTVEANLRMSKLGLIDIFEQARLPERTNLLVVADQFEELFRYRSAGAGTAEDSVAFVNLLLEAAEQRDFPIYVVLTMRSDFLGDAALMPGLPEAINEGQYLVPRMNREEIRSAVVGPARVAGADITPVLSTRLVNDVGSDPDQLSILQHALNRTWARWKHEGGGIGPLDLHHYEEIGTMTSALDQHAEKAYSELRDDKEKRLCQVLFQALTDRGTDARGIRRPTSMKVLCDLSGATVAQLASVIDVFRKPSRSFLMPPAAERLEPETVVDISHESLMRVWKRLIGWVEMEAESASRFRRLAESAALYRDGKSQEMADPELSITLKWWQQRVPTEAWANRYAPGFALAQTYLDKSREKRDREEQAAHDLERRKLRNARLGAVAAALISLVVIGVAWYMLNESKLRREAEDARRRAEEAVAEATAAKQLAERQRDIAQKTADAAKNAVAALSEAQSLKSLAEGSSKSAQDAREQATKDRYEATRDRAETAAASKLTEAQASLAALAAVSSGGTVIKPDRVSLQDLFDSSRGIEITATSETSKAGGQIRGMFGGTSPNPPDLGMRGEGQGNPEDAVTFFADGKPQGFVHWVSWRLRAETPVRSVALFARHDMEVDGYKFRRSISEFRLFATISGKPVRVARYLPSLPYGAGTQGILLAVCLPVQMEKGQKASEFKAEFVQGVDVLGQYSSPRIVQLDGYASADCTK